MELPKIKVADFEGPFDLLLHLIKKNKMDIYNIEIYKITNQYLRYLDEMKEMDLEITSEFIVIAATLIEIKSKSLLPKVKVEDENEEDIENIDVVKLLDDKKVRLGDVPEYVEYLIYKNPYLMVKGQNLSFSESFGVKNVQDTYTCWVKYEKLFFKENILS